MPAATDSSDDLHGQETDLEIIGVLLPHVKTRNFVDVGTEKGGFARAILRMGFDRGALCEPLPAHLETLHPADAWRRRGVRSARPRWIHRR